MPPRVSYWSGWLNPEMEGISKEVFLLSRHFDGSFVFGLSRYYNYSWNWKQRYAGINILFYPVFKVFAPIVERLFDITHIYDDLSNWFYLKNLGRRPVILTAVTHDNSLGMEYYKDIKTIVVDSESRRVDLLEKGFPESQVRLIYPGVDLDTYRPDREMKWRAGPFRALFASSPRTEDELAGRGVYQILEAAALMPEVEFLLLWRPWGDWKRLHRVLEEKIGNNGLDNVRIITGVFQNCLSFYRMSHTIMAPFSKGFGKPFPYSVAEGMACGLPAILGEGAAICDFLCNAGASVPSGSTGRSLALAIGAVRENREAMSKAARRICEEYFSERVFIKSYSDLYRVAANH